MRVFLGKYISRPLGSSLAHATRPTGSRVRASPCGALLRAAARDPGGTEGNKLPNYAGWTGGVQLHACNCFYVWFCQVIMRPRSGCPSYTTDAFQTLQVTNTLISYCKQFTFGSKLKVPSISDAPASRKKERLISFQMGQLYSSLRAHAVHSEHDLLNFWLWTVGVELWPNQCAHLEGKIQTTSRLSIP